MNSELINAVMPILEWIGLVGYGLIGWGMSQTSDVRVKGAVITACAINSLYFYALGMWISAAVVLLTAFRIAVSLKFRHPVVAIPFVVLAGSMPWILPSADVLSALAGIIGTIAVFWARGVWLKAILLSGTAIWLTNNALSGAWIGVLGEAFILAMGLKYLWQHRSEFERRRGEVRPAEQA